MLIAIRYNYTAQHLQHNTKTDLIIYSNSNDPMSKDINTEESRKLYLRKGYCRKYIIIIMARNFNMKANYSPKF